MKKNNMTFEEAMERLESAVRSLEGGNLNLDDAMKTYEEAISLLRFCHSTLENAERKIQVLLENENGDLTEEPFDVEDEA